jgi:hypothetical protein
LHPMVTVQPARPYPPRPTIAYVKELTALDASLQREILREWLARSESASPAVLSLADDYEDFVITEVRERPKAAEAPRKLPAWSFAVGALPVAIVVLVLAFVGRASAPLPEARPRPLALDAVSTVETKVFGLEPPTQPSESAVQPTPTVAAARKLPSTRAVPTAVPLAEMAAPVREVDTEDNSDFGDRK